MSNLKEKIRKFPITPGVYLMKDGKDNVVYVGKAINLRDRVSSYFGNQRDGRYQVSALMKKTSSIDYIETGSEKEALILEHSLIRKFKPKYNIMYRDDKSYTKIKITSYHKFPAIYVTRKEKKDKSTYYGPHPSGRSCHATVDIITQYFKIRNCSDNVFSNRSRPCIQYEIGRCTAPCVGRVSEKEYADQIMNMILFLDGKMPELITALENRMTEYSGDRRYEEAAHVRDIITGLKSVIMNKTEWDLSAKEPCKKKVGWNAIASSMAKRLGLTEQPEVVDAVDISNISGKFAVGSIVSSVHGKFEKSRYRIFNIEGTSEPNDYLMLNEVLKRYLVHNRFPPDLILIDGGKGHLMTVKKVFTELNLEAIPLVSVAKGKDRKSDEVYIPGRKNPLKFKGGDPLYLFLKRLRDEAHRFGISHYRKRHKTGNLESKLDNISGVGPVKKKTLIQTFGSIEKIKAATDGELKKIRGISDNIIKSIRKRL